MKTISFRTVLASGILALMLAGCAVLTVDVDVYKGPLANHKDVQMQQAAVMAKGAKPLLIALRDKLECNFENEENPIARDISLCPPERESELRQKSWYRPAYIPQKPDGSGPLRSSGAIRVNAILSLYEDRAPEEYQGLLLAIQREFEATLSELALLHADANADWRFWADYERVKMPDQGEKTVRTAANPQATNPGMLTDLRLLFQQFHKPGTNSFRETKEIIKLLSKIIPTNIAIFTDINNTNIKSANELSINRIQTRKAYQLLENEELLKTIYDELFDNPSKRDAFVERTRRIASAYAKAETHLSRTLELSLKLIELLSFDLRECPMKKEALDLGVQNVIELMDAPTSRQVLDDKLKNDVAIENYLRSNPLEASHRLLMNLSLSPLNLIVDISNSQDSPRRNSAAIKFRVNKISEILSPLGFERGRLPQGLDTMIEAYLNKEYRNAGNVSQEAQQEILIERSRLMDGLVYFAQKILFLANNHSLLLNNEHVLGLTARALIGANKLLFINYTAFNDSDTVPHVLQAVGNSILVQVDELRQFNSYQAKAITNGVTERAALNSAYTAGTRRTLEKLVTALTMESEVLKLEEKKYRADIGKLGPQIIAAKAKLDATNNNYDDLKIRSQAAIQNAANAEANESEIRVTFDFFKNYSAPLTDNPISEAVLHSKILEELKKRLQAAVINNSPDNSWPQIINIWTSLAASPAITGYAPTIFNTLTNRLAEKLTQAITAHQASKAASQKSIAELAKAKSNLDAATQELATANKDLATAKNNQQETQRKIPAYDELLKKLSNFEQDPKTALFRDGELALRSLMDQLRTDASKETNTAKKTLIQNAAQVLAARPLPPRAPPEINPQSQDSKDVLDSLISQLRYEYIRAVEDGGSQSPLALKYAQALEEAYKQRTGMIYIRPASSYLRTSFPATSLQRDASIGWQNMLERHGLRQLPFASFFENGKNQKTVLEIDKQFWQNVNRVRVAGGGRGNYVVAKDDLGNWYVKNYSSDPEDIIKTMKKLAMFSLGPAMGLNLPLSAVDKGASGASNSTRLELELGKYAQNYSNQTYLAFADASKQLNKKALNQELADAWKASSVPNDDQTALDAIVENASHTLVELPDKPKAAEQTSEDLLKALRSVRDYYQAIHNGIALKNNWTANANKTNYQAIAREKMNQHLGAFIRTRKESVLQYESALTVLGDPVK